MTGDSVGLEREMQIAMCIEGTRAKLANARAQRRVRWDLDDG